MNSHGPASVFLIGYSACKIHAVCMIERGGGVLDFVLLCALILIGLFFSIALAFLSSLHLFSLRISLFFTHLPPSSALPVALFPHFNPLLLHFSSFLFISLYLLFFLLLSPHLHPSRPPSPPLSAVVRLRAAARPADRRIRAQRRRGRARPKRLVALAAHQRSDD